MSYDQVKPLWIAQVTTPTQGFDLTQPIKRWIDTRATQVTQGGQLTYSYTLLFKDAHGETLRETLILSRDVAARANVPGPTSMPREGTPDFLRLPKVAEYSLPIRDLQPGEIVKLGPFNDYILSYGQAVVTTAELKALLLQVLDMLRGHGPLK